MNVHGTDCTKTKSWKDLIKSHERLDGVTIAALFDREPDRAERMHTEAAGLYLDFSKNRIDATALSDLLAFAPGDLLIAAGVFRDAEIDDHRLVDPARAQKDVVRRADQHNRRAGGIACGPARFRAPDIPC